MDLAKCDSPCSVASSTLTMDLFKKPVLPAPKKKKKKVLDEETYLVKLSKIIKRDFYPDLDNLRDRLDYIEAKETNNYTKLREICARYVGSRSTPSSSRVEDSPATFETPDHPSHNNTEDSMRSLSERRVIDENKYEEEPLPSLDKFLNDFTSEDNDHFEQLMEETRSKIKLKNPWLYEAEDKHNSSHAPNLALTSLEEQVRVKKLAIVGTSVDKDTRPKQVENWNYKTFNSVMYPPEGAPLSNEQMAKNAKFKKKEVVHSNTRFESNPFSETVSQATMMEASAIQASKKEGKVGIDGKELSKDPPTVNGYSYIPNPSPVPGVDASPLMTWGEVEGTPFQLDGSQTPLRGQCTPTPSYRIPKVPDKDQLVMKLVEKANQNHKDRKHKALTVARSYFGTPVSKFGKQSSMDRLSSMSPAAQKLFGSKLRVHRGSDSALRASYTPSTGNSRRGTPGYSTPGSVRSLGKTPNKDENNTLTTSYLTDNLLRLPKQPKSNEWCKASDFF